MASVIQVDAQAVPMELELPAGPAHVTDFDRLDVQTALPLLVADGEILAFVAVREFEGGLFAYDPFGGWRAVNTESLEQDASLEAAWIQSRSDGITDPVPSGMRAFTDLEDARRVKEELLEAFNEGA